MVVVVAQSGHRRLPASTDGTRSVSSDARSEKWEASSEFEAAAAVEPTAARLASRRIHDSRALLDK
jgi:hypothetical protein